MPTKLRKKGVSSKNSDKPAQVKHPKHSDKLGDVVDQPPNSAFKKPLPRRRLPGWHPDTQKADGFTLYPEEGLRTVKPAQTTLFEPFAPFFDDTPASANVAWLGKMLPEPSWGSSKFDEYLWDIAQAVRRYNARLYFLRRLHFHENAAPLGYNYPKRNPHGDQDDPEAGKEIPDPKADPNGFAKFVGTACKLFNDSVEELNELLDQGTSKFYNTIADMVEVNGYIISMRIISPGPAPDELTATQIGGSSSSYVYISSPFSSSAP